MHPWKKDIQIPTTKLTHAQTLTYTRMHACIHTHILVYTHGRKAKGATACLAVGEGHLPSRPQADLRGRTREQDTTWIKHMASAMHPAPKCCRGRSTKRQNASMVCKCARTSVQEGHLRCMHRGREPFAPAWGVGRQANVAPIAGLRCLETAQRGTRRASVSD